MLGLDSDLAPMGWRRGRLGGGWQRESERDWESEGWLRSWNLIEREGDLVFLGICEDWSWGFTRLKWDKLERGCDGDSRRLSWTTNSGEGEVGGRLPLARYVRKPTGGVVGVSRGDG